MLMKRRVLLCLLLLPFLFLMASKLRSQSRAAAAKQSKPAPQSKSAVALRALSTAQRHWVTTSCDMTLDERLQLLFPTITEHLPDGFACLQQMLHDVNDIHAGGFITVTRMTPGN
jgi:hypothetical protein